MNLSLRRRKLKQKHNKKRNTAILYESLVRELTKAILNKNNEIKQKVVSMLKEHFSSNTLLGKELKLYKVLCETYDLSPRAAEKLVFEMRSRHEELSYKGLFKEQSNVIKKINQSFGKSFFSSFIPNYKTAASIYQIFNQETPSKDRILLEETMIEKLCSSEEEQPQMKPIDHLTYKTFVKRFNEEYAKPLLKEQKELLSKYISSFADNGVEFKIFLNEEVSRLKEKVSQALTSEEIKSDSNMVEKTKKVLNIMNDFRNEHINKEMIKKVLNIQDLVREIDQ